MLALPPQLVEKFLLSLLLGSLRLLDPLRQLGHFTAQRVSLPFQRDEVLMLRILLAQRSFQRRAPVASITSRSNPSATPLAGGICSSAARNSSSSGYRSP